MRIIPSYLVIGKTVKHGKEFIEEFNLNFDTKTVNYYRLGDLEFRFTTIEQLENGSLKDKKRKFEMALVSEAVTVGNFHHLVRPLVKKWAFTVF